MAKKKAAKKKTAKKKAAAKKLPSESKTEALIQRKVTKATRGKKQTYLLIGALIGFLMGLALAGIVWQNYLQAPEEQEVRTYCQIDIASLWGKSCNIHEDCYGRTELCSPIDRKCVLTSVVDKTNTRNVLIPNDKIDCEVNGGIWTTEVLEENGGAATTAIGGFSANVINNAPTQQVPSDAVPIQSAQPTSFVLG